MAVHYKFKSAKDYDSILIEGQFISVGNLKERIFESKHLGRGTDFDLMISNPQSNEEYVDESAMIPKNASVLIRRIPGFRRRNIVTKSSEYIVPMPKTVEKAEELPPQCTMLVHDSSTTMISPIKSEWDEFGNDLYAIPEASLTQSSNPVVDVVSASMIDEDSKIKALIDTPALDWSRQAGFGRGMGGRMSAGRGFGRGGFERNGFERKTPPTGYVCYRCKVPGHLIQHCPTNGDPSFDVKKVKPPTGIPKSMLMATPNGSYALPSGAVAVLKPNEDAFEKAMEGMPSARPVADIPPELKCPLCKEVMKDAALTSKCCFRSFCDKCIRDHLISKSMCVCGAIDILADDLIPNQTVRETISRLLDPTTFSAENTGSQMHVQEVDSACQTTSKIPSPVPSAASKDEPKQTHHPLQLSLNANLNNVKEADTVNEDKTVTDCALSTEKKTVKNTDQSEAAPESMITKVPNSLEAAPVHEEAQEKVLGGEQAKKKKKKKTRVPVTGDMQWNGYQDLGAENYTGIPLGAYNNPYWVGGMPMGYDGFMPPFGGPMPNCMGYAQTPFDVPFGMMPHDPFAAPGYMMPPLPQRDLSELRFNNMNMSKMAPTMSREEFEAKKADIRMRREFERRNEREPLRNGRAVGKDGHADYSPMKSKTAFVPKSDQNHHSSSSQHLVRPPIKRRSYERDDNEKERNKEKYENDEKLKNSVFSRIKYSQSDEKDSKRRKTSSSSEANGVIFKDDPHHHYRSSSSISNRNEVARHRASGKRSSYDHYSSEEEEDDDDDYHFKRMPSKRQRRERV